LERLGVETRCFSNDNHVPRPEFQRLVAEHVPAEYSPAEWVVEASEVGSPTLLLPPDYRTHIRLHCPSAIVQRYNSRRIDREALNNELEVIRRADVVSSPSHALLRIIGKHLNGTAVRVFKHPAAAQVTWKAPQARTYDVIFLGKFVALKGIGFLNRILAALPAHYRVCIVGRGAVAFDFTPERRCRIDIFDHIDGPRRLGLLGDARVALQLSRFENCSMVVLECLAHGVAVVGWDVGGHSEIAAPPLLRLVPYGDVDALVRTIVSAGTAPYQAREEFEFAVRGLAEDFRNGWQQVSEALEHRAAEPAPA
jgi:glycosyltransferase involved in cell wall biosynthesis